MRTPRTLGRLGRLVRRREVQVVAGLWVGATVVASFFHATARLGYPSALLANVLVGLLGPWIGVAAARVEQDLAHARAAASGLPPGLRASNGPLRAALLPVGVSGVLVAALVAVTYATALVLGDQGWSDPARLGTLLYIAMTLESVPVAVTLGVLVAALSHRRLVVGLALPGFLAASVAVSLWPFLTGPQLGVYNHLLGFVPFGGGPAFDIGDALAAYRVLTLAWAGLGLALLGLTLDGRFRLAQPVGRWRRLPAALLTVAALAGVVALELRGPTAGFDVSAREAARQLGPTVRSAHFVIHLPEGLSRRQMAQVVARHERAYARVLAYLQLPEGTGAPITSWVMNGSPPDLLGAGDGDHAKPWRREIYVGTDARPDGLNADVQAGVGRGVAYVVLGTLGRGPLRVSPVGGLLPNRGFETGLAVAATAGWDATDALQMSPDRRAEALRATGLARDPRRQFSILGLPFGAQDDEALEGSFVSWLVRTQGIASVKRAFHAGDLRVLGDPEALFRAWGAALDRAPPTLAERRQVVEDSLAGPWNVEPISCLGPPHRATDLHATFYCAHQALAEGRTRAAAAWLRRSLVVAPDLSPARLASIRTALDHEEPRVALERLEALRADPKVDPDHAAEQLERQGDRRWRAGKLDEAAAAYRLALKADPCGHGPAAEVKLAALRDDALAHRPQLVLAARAGTKAARALLAAAPSSAVAEYLVGRGLTCEAPAKALPHLRRALSLELPTSPDLRPRILAAIAEARWDTGDAAGAVAAWDEVASYPASTCRRRARFRRWEAARDRDFVAWRARHPHWAPTVVPP